MEPITPTPQVTETPQTSYITIDDVKKIEIKIGLIISAEKVEGADKLIKFMVDFNEGTLRQILSGIALHVSDISSLVGKKFPFVTNLQPRTIRSLESNGMILAASDTDGHFSLIEPTSSDINPGSRVG